ncbi:MAG: methyltransferase domain-containing protein [Ignavibacteria bacterium]
MYSSLIKFEIKRNLRSVRKILTQKKILKPSVTYKPGRCNVCGVDTIFLAYPNETYNNSNSCIYCGCTARFRLIGLALANLILNKTQFVKDLELNCIPENKNIKILDTSYKSSLYPFLKNKISLRMSEYYPDYPVGKKVLKLENQDLLSLKVKDRELDYIITSEVFEHIYDPWKAFAEINRCLKKGGAHIFTVPYYEDKITLSRATPDENNNLKILLPEVYHLNPLTKNGSLVVTDFGNDLVVKLEQLGFKTDYIKLTDEYFGFKETYLFVSQKMQQLIAG